MSVEKMEESDWLFDKSGKRTLSLAKTGWDDSDSPVNSPLKKKAELGDDPPNAVLLEAINKLSTSQKDVMDKLSSIENSVTENLKNIQALTASVQSTQTQIGALTSRVDPLEIEVKNLKDENKKLLTQVNEQDAYSRRWNLKISGIAESKDENVKMMVIDLFSRVSPGLRDSLQRSVDIAHRLGPRGKKEDRIDENGKEKGPRRIIVRFAYRAHRDQIWADAKDCQVLKQKNIKITEDLTQHTREQRAKLWPMVEAARSQGKRAGFTGPFAIIDGKKFSADDVPDPPGASDKV